MSHAGNDALREQYKHDWLDEWDSYFTAIEGATGKGFLADAVAGIDAGLECPMGDLEAYVQFRLDSK